MFLFFLKACITCTGSLSHTVSNITPYNIHNKMEDILRFPLRDKGEKKGTWGQQPSVTAVFTFLQKSRRDEALS